MQRANQPPAAAIVLRDRDNVAMNLYHVPVAHYVQITFTMNGGKGTQLTTGLPYVAVHAQPDHPRHWRVLGHCKEVAGKTSSLGKVFLFIRGPGKYRIYIAEPTETFPPSSTFWIQHHALANGRDSEREVQPLVELDVIEAANLSLSIRTTHPNGLSRTRGSAADSIAADGPTLQLTEDHVTEKKEKALNLGRHLISFQAWADASRTYGTDHPLIVASDYREQLRIIYGERLTTNSRQGADLNDRILEHGEKRIEFNHQSTTGGRGRLSFRDDNGHAGNRMTADESLRRTHPAAMEFLLRMMHDLNISYMRSTGAWRPHFGSVLHRYASSLDLTHADATVADSDGQLHLVKMHFHRDLGKACNPIPTGGAELLRDRRRRELSFRVHAYIARAKQSGVLGWLGGPWRLAYGQLSLPQPPGQAGVAFMTDDVHRHHIHISLGQVEE